MSNNLESYTYAAVWARSGNLYSLIRYNDTTYGREIVASFDELSAKENRELANKCADALNNSLPVFTDADIERACEAALEHMPALLQKTIKKEGDTIEETITVCPPFEFVERFLRPAMLAAITTLKGE